MHRWDHFSINKSGILKRFYYYGISLTRVRNWAVYLVIFKNLCLYPQSHGQSWVTKNFYGETNHGQVDHILDEHGLEGGQQCHGRVGREGGPAPQLRRPVCAGNQPGHGQPPPKYDPQVRLRIPGFASGRADPGFRPGFDHCIEIFYVSVIFSRIWTYLHIMLFKFVCA